MRLFRPVALALTTGAAVMTLELLAPRLVARHLGTSALVWSATLAVFLGGLAAGNRAGGALFDRFGQRMGPRGLVAALALASAGMLLLVPILDRFAEDAFRGLPLLPRALASLGVACLPAAILLGGVPPAVAAWAIGSSESSPSRGKALGAVAAAGAIGSVLGTFATGFVLIPGMPTSVAIRVAAAAMAAVAAIAWIPWKALPRSPPRRDPERSGAPRSRPAEEPLSGRAIDVMAATAGAALLVLEVLAGRSVSVYVGNGIYTWTSVIGGVLLALAIGNAVGGLLADRMGPRRALGLLFLVASVLAALTMWAPIVLTATGGGVGPLPVRITKAVLATWGPTVAAIGAASTVLGRAAVAGGAGDGSAIGRVYALGTAGAIAGGLVTSPWLLPALGASATACVVALALALASRAAGRRAEWPWIAGVVLVGFAASSSLPFARSAGLALGVREDAEGEVLRESPYTRIRVDDAPEAYLTGRRVKRLRLDALVHGFVDLDDPTWTGYGYEGVYAAVTERVAPKGRPVRALFIGGGPYVFQRYLRATRADAAIDVAEIDPEVTETAKTVLALSRAETMRIVHEDARTFVRDLPSDAPPYDLVYGDAFNDLSVPFHLTTLEFARAVKARMAKDGVYLLNAIDAMDSGRFVGALLTTLSKAFAHVYVTGLDRRRDGQENFILVASDREIDMEGLTRVDPQSSDRSRRLPVVVYGPDEIALLLQRGRGVVLTDDFAPVENLLEPLQR